MNWIVFVYKIPSKPTKYRAYVWREMKKIGALYLQDGVCLVPDFDDVQLFISDLGKKIISFGGQENAFHSKAFSEEQTKALILQFNEAREKEYEEITPWLQRIMQYFEEEETWEYSEAQVQKIREDFRKMQRQFQIIESRDYFETEMGKKLLLKIDQCRKQISQLF
jgi:hypothetical protein